MSLERVKQNESYFVAKAATRVVVAGLSLVALGLYAASGASKEMQATDYTGFIWGQIGVVRTHLEFLHGYALSYNALIYTVLLHEANRISLRSFIVADAILNVR